MTITMHELKQNWKSLLVWTVSISFFIVICVFLYPEMKNEMAGISNLFASMGAFTAAFGMDKLNFGSLVGFYALECGNVLGIGGAMFASLTGANALAKEEKDHTAEFLLTHPVSRARILTEKLLSLLLQLLLMNVVIFLFALISLSLIGEPIPWTELFLLHLAFFLVQAELFAVCFGISAFLRRGSLGIGLGLAVIMYFFNIVANISEQAEFLKYITPFGYADGADIVSDLCLSWEKVAAGMCLGVLGILCAYVKYCRKDIH